MPEKTTEEAYYECGTNLSDLITLAIGFVSTARSGSNPSEKIGQEIYDEAAGRGIVFGASRTGKKGNNGRVYRMKCPCGKTHKTTADRKRSHQVKRALLERELYRARAIDEVAAHHKDATAHTATFDVDLEVHRQLNWL